MSSNYYRLVKDYPDLKYRNNQESALFLVKLVNSLYQIEDNYKFPTTILGYWGFVWEADEDEFFVGKRELTTAGDIPKPIQTGFEMLAKLKENRIEIIRSKKDNQFGILATKSKLEEIVLIAYNYEEDEKDLDRSDDLQVELKGLKANATYNLVETSLDQTNNNTFAAWEKIGSPANSKNVDLLTLQKAAELSPTHKNIF
ncbi:MAG: hypothetical protein HQ522_07175 [Bacteroidetes bacterium]|nr:hypothetical protein [Bacteroidota bacterium]